MCILSFVPSKILKLKVLSYTGYVVHRIQTPTQPPRFSRKSKVKNTQTQQTSPPRIKKCNSKKCKTCSFIQDGLSSCTFKNIGQVHHIKQTITCAFKNLIYMIQCRKCKTLQMLQQNTSDKQNAHYVTDLESIVEPYKTRPPMQYRSTLIKKDTNSRTSNLSHSNSLILKENPYVELANHFI